MKGISRLMYKKLIAAALAILLLFITAACDNGDDASPETAGHNSTRPTASHNAGSEDDPSDDDDDEFFFDDDDDGGFILIEDIPSLAWMYEDDDPADLRLSLRRPDSPPAGVGYPGETSAKGDVVWFGALSWRVLEVSNGKALLLCENLLDFRPFRYGDEDPDTWSQCGIRNWLNDAFYNGTFTDEEMALIVETYVANDDNLWFDTDGGEDTYDNLFLLSIEEIVTYFGDSGKLSNHEDRDVWIIYDDYNDARVAQYIDAEVVTWWWLRSPGMNYKYAATVSIDGSINVSGDYVLSGGGGVRPAMWILL